MVATPLHATEDCSSDDESYQLIGGLPEEVGPNSSNPTEGSVCTDVDKIRLLVEEINQKNKEIEILTKHLDAKAVANARLMDKVTDLNDVILGKDDEIGLLNILHKKEIRKKVAAKAKAIQNCESEKKENVKTLAHLLDHNHEKDKTLHNCISYFLLLAMFNFIYIITPWTYFNTPNYISGFQCLFCAIVFVRYLYLHAKLNHSSVDWKRRAKKAIMEHLPFLIANNFGSKTSLPLPETSTRNVTLEWDAAECYGFFYTRNFVSYVLKRRNAKVAGIQAGHEIISINGVELSTLSCKQIKKEFEKAGGKAELVIQYNPETAGKLARMEDVLRHRPTLI